MLINSNREVFMGRRIGTKVGGWQMPQGGVDEHEDLRSAALRELHEEVGINRVEILEVSSNWLSYDLPPEMAASSWEGKYRGQRQRWFAMSFAGQDSDINLYATEHPEFDTWAWMMPERCLHEIIDFKKPLYESVFSEFGGWLEP